MRLFRRSAGSGLGLGGLRRRLGVRVEGGLLETALTHSSFANENPALCPRGDNERLEFLGDAVLQFTVARLLCERFPEAGVGELTRLRAAVVSEQALFRAAEDLGLGEHLRLGKGEEASGGRRRRSVLADAFEAVVGAVYLSSGVRGAETFVARWLGPFVDRAAEGPLLDHKTALQEAAQAAGREVVYRLVETSGPEHEKVFTVEVTVDGVVAGRGTGRTKKEAEQAAAGEVLRSGGIQRQERMG